VKSNASSFPCRDPWQGRARPPRATAGQGRQGLAGKGLGLGVAFDFTGILA
jgi:hypothetical protein